MFLKLCKNVTFLKKNWWVPAHSDPVISGQTPKFKILLLRLALVPRFSKRYVCHTPVGQKLWEKIIF
jgi:hypothetical protein